MNKFNDEYLRSHSLEELRAEDYKTLAESIAHNVAEADKHLKKETLPNPLALAAVFDSIAYIGGGMYIDPNTPKTWAREISTAVAQYNHTVVWGPVWHYPSYTWDSESDACMYVAQSNITGNQFVVIRGTNFLSMESWLNEDFGTYPQQALTPLIPNAPANALVAWGTLYGLTLLSELQDSTTNNTILQYFANLVNIGKLPKSIIVTGHSLGGTLTPPLFVYLNHFLNHDTNGTRTVLLPISFAGLTPGNAAFNSYFDQELGPYRFYRFVNSLDIAPFCWWSESGVLTIYDHNNGNGCGTVYFKPTLLIEDLFSGLDGLYQEMGHKILLAGHCSQPFSLWETLALYQHHVTTYLALMMGNTHALHAWKEEHAAMAQSA